MTCMVWERVTLRKGREMTKEQKMIEAWVKKNKPKRYQHGERPEGMEPPDMTSWGRRRVSKAEVQAAKDAEGE